MTTKREQKARRSSTEQPYFLDAPSTANDIVLSVLTQISRKYLFVDSRKRAICYFVIVLVLSFIAEFNVLPDQYYFIQKNNFINRYITKLGWFWLCLLLVPFIWLTSLLHHGSRRKAFRDLTRLLVATFQWYFWTNGFVYVEQTTGTCHGATNASRDHCASEGGKWIPGFDVSGHTFIFLYSALIIDEEVCSFRNWPARPLRRPFYGSNGDQTMFFLDYKNFRTATRLIQYLFLAIFALHLVWDSQLLITLLYYHTFVHKVLGALIGIFCWAVTYRFWYLMAFPFSPIRRHMKAFDTNR